MQQKDIFLIPTGTAIHFACPYYDKFLMQKRLTPDDKKAIESFIGSLNLTPEQLMGLPDSVDFDTLKLINEKMATYPDNNVRVTYPQDIFNAHYFGADGLKFTYSPKQRAQLLYDAVTAVDTNGSYLHHNVYITGGSNTEDVIWELEKLIQKNGKLPQRNQDLKIFGFSDATQLLHYLGQQGIATPYYYSKNHNELIREIDEGNFDNAGTQSFELIPFNQSARNLNGEKIDGCALPGNFVQIEDRPTHFAKLSQKDSNFVVVEFRSKKNIDSFLKLYKEKLSDKNICLLLSKDMPHRVKKYLNKQLKKQQLNIPVFDGMPVGHGECQLTGEGIPLFCVGSITVDNGKAVLNTETTAVHPDKLNNVLDNVFRSVIESKGGKENRAVVHGIYGSDGVTFANLDKLEKGGSELTIVLKQEYDKQKNPVNPWQQMDMAVKKLIEKKVINPEQLTSIKFEGADIKPEHLHAINTQMNYICQSRLPKTTIQYDIVNNNQKTSVSISKNQTTRKLITGMTALSGAYSSLMNATQSKPTNITAFANLRGAER